MRGSLKGRAFNTITQSKLQPHSRGIFLKPKYTVIYFEKSFLPFAFLSW